MSKDDFVTGNLHRISARIAEAAKKHDGTSAPEPETMPPSLSGGKNSAAPVPAGTEKRKRLDPEAENALRKRHEEFERFRRDILFRIEEAEAEADGAKRSRERLAEEYARLLEKTAALKEEFGKVGEPDPDDPRYQLILSELCRTLERMRLELIRIDAALKEKSNAGPDGARGEFNLFAEMGSLRISQLLRIGFWTLLPALAAMLLASGIIAAFIFLTFRAGI